MTLATTTQLHATCVAIDDIGVLILGESGTGKSDLALRLIDGGAQLIADDRTDVRRVGAQLIATAPETLAGRIEARGIGIVPLAPDQICDHVSLAFALNLQNAETTPRLPEPETQAVLGIDLPLWRIDPAAPSAPARVRLLVSAHKRGIVRFDE